MPTDCETFSLLLASAVDRRDQPAAFRVLQDAASQSSPIHTQVVNRLMRLLQEQGSADTAWRLGQAMQG
jgi:hypothetical protein